MALDDSNDKNDTLNSAELRRDVVKFAEYDAKAALLHDPLFKEARRQDPDFVKLYECQHKLMRPKKCLSAVQQYAATFKCSVCNYIFCIDCGKKAHEDSDDDHQFKWDESVRQNTMFQLQMQKINSKMADLDRFQKGCRWLDNFFVKTGGGIVTGVSIAAKSTRIVFDKKVIELFVSGNRVGYVGNATLITSVAFLALKSGWLLFKAWNGVISWKRCAVEIGKAVIETGIKAAGTLVGMKGGIVVGNFLAPGPAGTVLGAIIGGTLGLLAAGWATDKIFDALEKQFSSAPQDLQERVGKAQIYFFGDQEFAMYNYEVLLSRYTSRWKEISKDKGSTDQILKLYDNYAAMLSKIPSLERPSSKQIKVDMLLVEAKYHSQAKP